jgi:hypothetical protein
MRDSTVGTVGAMAARSCGAASEHCIIGAIGTDAIGIARDFCIIPTGYDLLPNRNASGKERPREL